MVNISGVRVGRVICKKDLGKDDHLEDAVEVVFEDQTFEYHVKPVIEYFEYFKNKNGSFLNGTVSIRKEGDMVSPLFTGGPVKGREKPPITLAFSVLSYDKIKGTYMVSPLEVETLKDHFKIDEIRIEIMESEINHSSWIIAYPLVYPFTVIRFFKIFYQRENTARLLKKIYGKYENLIKLTLNMLKIPTSHTISPESLESFDKIFLTVYRCQRTFASAVIDSGIIRELVESREGPSGLIIEQHLSYIISDEEEPAYYYSAALNYMIFKIKQLRLGAFIHNQFARPLKALKEAGLEWDDSEWQIEVAKLSKEVHKQARETALSALSLPPQLPVYEVNDEGRDRLVRKSLGKRVDIILKDQVRRVDKLRSLFRIIDDNVNREQLVLALRNVLEVKKGS